MMTSSEKELSRWLSLIDQLDAWRQDSDLNDVHIGLKILFQMKDFCGTIKTNDLKINVGAFIKNFEKAFIDNIR